MWIPSKIYTWHHDTLVYQFIEPYKVSSKSILNLGDLHTDFLSSGSLISFDVCHPSLEIICLKYPSERCDLSI